MNSAAGSNPVSVRSSSQRPSAVTNATVGRPWTLYFSRERFELGAIVRHVDPHRDPRSRVACRDAWLGERVGLEFLARLAPLGREVEHQAASSRPSPEPPPRRGRTAPYGAGATRVDRGADEAERAEGQAARRRRRRGHRCLADSCRRLEFEVGDENLAEEQATGEEHESDDERNRHAGSSACGGGAGSGDECLGIEAPENAPAHVENRHAARGDARSLRLAGEFGRGGGDLSRCPSRRRRDSAPS
jgi:hypothetical protein